MAWMLTSHRVHARELRLARGAYTGKPSFAILCLLLCLLSASGASPTTLLIRVPQASGEVHFCIRKPEIPRSVLHVDRLDRTGYQTTSPALQPPCDRDVGNVSGQVIQPATASEAARPP